MKEIEMITNNLIFDHQTSHSEFLGKGNNFDANGNIVLSNVERLAMIQTLEKKFGEVFEILRISRDDPNSADTPARLAKMWVNELFAGRFEAAPALTTFPNRKNNQSMVISKGISVMSVCSHHWQTISGVCSVAYIPSDKVIGLSKLSRIVEWFSRRGQIQEELTEQIADYIDALLEPKGVAVKINAKHFCMIARGVKSNESEAEMITTAFRGEIAESEKLKVEFLTQS